MIQKDNMPRGFTLIEILIVVVVIAVLAAGIGVSLSRYTSNQALAGAVNIVAAELADARSRTLSSQGSSQYGVRFEEDGVTLFKGAAYDEGDPANEATPLDDRVEISDISLAGGATSVVFDRLSGETSEFGTITISLSSDASKQKIITIQKTGLVSY